MKLRKVLFLIPILVFLFSFPTNVVKASVNKENDTAIEEKSNANKIVNDNVVKSFSSTGLADASSLYSEPEISSEDTVHVKTADEFIDAIYNNDDGSVTFNNRGGAQTVSHIHKIVLDNNINLHDSKKYSSIVNESANYYYLSVNHGTLVIDGAGYNLDMRRTDIALVSGMKNQNWTFENIVIEGSSYYGPVSVNSSDTTLNYSNMTYYGSQLIWSSGVQNSKVNIYGNCNVHSLYQYQSYPASNPDGQTVLCDSSGNQQNMQTGDLEFHAGSKYYGETYNGTCLELYGGVTMDENSSVELHPHGTSAENSPDSGSGYGLYFLNNGYYKPSLNFLDNTTMDIYCDNGNLTGPPKPGSVATKDMVPNNPNEISPAIYANGKPTLSMNSKKSSLNIIESGAIHSNRPVATFQGITANISNSSTFSVSVKNPGTYNPGSGVVYIGNNSNVNIGENGGFEVQSDALVGGYLMFIPQASFNVTRPRSFLLDNGGGTKNRILYMNDSQYINAQDIIASANGYSYNGDTQIAFDNIPLHKMFLANTGGSYFSYQKIRTFGRYKDLYNINQQLLSATDSSKNYTREFNRLQFTKSPNPTISMTKRYTDKNDPKLTGNIKDDDGNVLAGAYIRIYLDDDKNNSDKYISPTASATLSDDDVANIINSKTILTSASKSDIPATGTGAGTSFAKNTIKTSDFTSAASGSSEYNQFDKYLNANGSLSTAFNGISTVSESYPYIAITDANGNFSFNVPDSVWDRIGSEYKILDVVASYNGGDSAVKQVMLNNRPDLSISNGMQNLTYANSNVDENNLKYVYQGSALKDGDILQFNNNLDNNSSSVPISGFTYIQPVPSSMDTSTLQISYDGGKTFSSLTSDKYKVTDTNYLDTSGGSTVGYKNICLNGISLNTSSNMNLSIKGTLRNKDGTFSNDKVSFLPYILDGNLDSSSDNYYSYSPAKGKVDTISYASGDDFNFIPKDITFGNIPSYKEGWISGKSIDPDNLGLQVEDNRREKTNLKIFVSQENNHFTNVDNPGYGFENDLMFKDGNTMHNLNQGPYQIIDSSNPQNIYWNNNRKIMMDMNLKGQPKGRYTIGLTWSMTDSL